MIATDKRIFFVGGHYGSGKTEFCINLSILLNEQGVKTALIDLDLVNPYFRSREKSAMLETKGIHVYGNFFDSEITMEIPALSARVKEPFEDPDMFCIVDLGGNAAGALTAIQFSKYFLPETSEFLAVVNKNRPETAVPAATVAQLCLIQERINMHFTGLINNTHLLRETKLKDIKAGAAFAREVSSRMEIPLVFSCCPFFLIDELKASEFGRQLGHPVIPMKLIMRDSWLDMRL